MIKLFKFIFLGLLIFTPAKSSENTIKIRVNNEIITSLDLESEYNYLLALNNKLKDLDDLIIKKLAKQSIIRETIKKEELSKYYDLDKETEFLDGVIKEFYTRLNIKDINEFSDYLNGYNLKLDNVKNKIKIEMLWNKLIGSRYRNLININKKSLREQIEKNSTKNFSNEYELSEIVFKINSTNNLDEEVDIIQKTIVEQGFSIAANIYSIADSSKFGGDIGWIEEKNLSKKIIQGIQELKVGEISTPIKIPNGFLILKVKSKKDKIINVDKDKLLQ
jgi:peptidyl-prolyl cis-trans isomerase SurA